MKKTQIILYWGRDSNIMYSVIHINWHIYNCMCKYIVITLHNSIHLAFGTYSGYIHLWYLIYSMYLYIYMCFNKWYRLWYTISATTHHHMMFLALPWGREKTISSMLSKVRAYVFIYVYTKIGDGGPPPSYPKKNRTNTTSYRLFYYRQEAVSQYTSGRSRYCWWKKSG